MDLGFRSLHFPKSKLSLCMLLGFACQLTLACCFECLILVNLLLRLSCVCEPAASSVLCLLSLQSFSPNALFFFSANRALLDNASLLRDRLLLLDLSIRKIQELRKACFPEPPSLRDLSSFRDGRVLILMPATWNRLIKSSQQALRPLGPKSRIPRSGGLLSSSTLLFSHLSRASILQSWDLMGQVRLVPASAAVSRFGCVCGWRLANCGSSSQQAIVNRASRHLKKAVMSI